MIPTSFKSLIFSRFQSFVVAALLCVIGWSNSYAQGNGISSDGRDYYIGYMPGLNFTSTNPYYVLIGSYADNNVTINYFNDKGEEIGGPTLNFTKTEVKQVALDRYQMRPTKPGEIVEYKSAHIKSKLPISVQLYSEGQITGGMYLALPTTALGKKYVISSYNDNPTISAALQSGWQGQNLRDSSSSEFMVIAPFNNTTVQITPNATTYAGQLGVSTGEGSNGTQHPFSVTLSKGQTYWVRSNPTDRENDLSGTVVIADKPIAVIAGHERALLGDPSGIWRFMDNDFRDMMIEQMTPVEAWEAEGNVSIPFMPPMTSSTRMLENGRGDMYRIYEWDPSGAITSAYIGGNISPFDYQMRPFQAPAVQIDNVEQAVNIMGRDGKKIYVVMYDMFQGIHDSDPGKGMNTKGGAPQSGGGDQKMESTNYTCPNEMNVVPESRWRRTGIFKVPQNANYRGAQFINVISYKDGLSKLLMKGSQGDYKPLSQWPTKGVFQIPLRPDLVGLRLMLAAGNYLIKSDSAFICYSYGRTEGWYKNDFGYAAPVGQALGSKSELQKPQAVITPTCSAWDVKLTDSRPDDEGLADVMLLDDPDGVVTRPARVSVNVRLNPAEPEFTGNDSVLTFKIVVIDPLKDAVGYLYAIDKAGNDTVFEVHYSAPKVAFTPDLGDMRNTLIDQQACVTYTFYNNSSKGGGPINITGTSFKKNEGSFVISSTSKKLPYGVMPGDSLQITVCYTAVDVDVDHIDTVQVETECFPIPAGVIGSGITPLIYASDIDFGNVMLGAEKCDTLHVQNVGKAPFTLTKQYLLHNTTEFSFSDDAKLPATLQPGESIVLNFCYKPTKEGKDSTWTDWGHNLPDRFKHEKKDWSYLRGTASEPAVIWDRNELPFATECHDNQTLRATLMNATKTNDVINNVKIIGPDAAEFSIVAVESNVDPNNSFPMDAGAKLWFDIKFTPDVSKGFVQRNATLKAYPQISTKQPEVQLNTKTVHAELAADKTSLDLGTFAPGAPGSQVVTLSNAGDADLIVKTVSLTSNDPNTVFTMNPVLNVGDHIKPGVPLAITISANAPSQGKVTGSFDVTGETACPNPISIPLSIIGDFADVTGVGFDFGTQYVDCRESGGVVTFQDKGTIPITLKGVAIDGPDKTLFVLRNNPYPLGVDSQHVTVGSVMHFDDKLSFNVAYKPSKANMHLNAPQVHFIYSYVDVNGNLMDDQDYAVNLTGNPDFLRDTIAVRDVGYNNQFSASTAEFFDVPIKLALHNLPTNADVYGYMFKVTYDQDLFKFIPEKSTADPNADFEFFGGQTAGQIDPPVEGDKKLNEIFIKARARKGTPLTTTEELARLHFQLMVARESATDITVSDGAFLDKDGNTLCYVEANHLPGSFIAKEFCGDQTVRSALGNGSIATQIINFTPNPVKTTATLDYKVRVTDMPITVEIFDVLGQKVSTVIKDKIHAKGEFKLDIDGSKFANGTYTVRVSTPTTTESQTMVVNR